MNETIVCVLGFSEWFIQEDNKRGISVHYLNSSPETNPSKHGYMPVKKSVDDSVVVNLRGQEFPVVCKMKFDLVTKGNAMDIAIKGLTPLANVALYEALS